MLADVGSVEYPEPAFVHDADGVAPTSVTVPAAPPVPPSG